MFVPKPKKSGFDYLFHVCSCTRAVLMRARPFFAGCRARASFVLINLIIFYVLVLYQCNFDETEAICLRAVEREQGRGPAFVSLLSAACLPFFCGEKKIRKGKTESKAGGQQCREVYVSKLESA
jgi:hypothetical protein